MNPPQKARASRLPNHPGAGGEAPFAGGRAMRLLASFGGELRGSGMGLEVLEGSHDGRRLVVFEFPSMEKVREFWSSSAYAKVKRLREGAAKVDVWAVPAP